MEHINEVINTWLSEWNYCEICEHYHYRQTACNCNANKLANIPRQKT